MRSTRQELLLFFMEARRRPLRKLATAPPLDSPSPLRPSRMTAPVQQLINDVARILAVADATATLPLQQELLRTSHRYLQQATDQIEALCSEEGEGEDRDSRPEDLSSIPALEEVEHIDLPEDRATETSSARRRSNNYNIFMSTLLPLLRAQDPQRAQRANFTLAATLWQRHKSLKDLELILTRCHQDIREMPKPTLAHSPLRAVNLDAFGSS